MGGLVLRSQSYRIFFLIFLLLLFVGTDTVSKIRELFRISRGGVAFLLLCIRADISNVYCISAGEERGN